MTRPRLLFAATFLALLVLGGYLAYDWKPDRQLRKATERLLADIESRDWESVRDTLTDDYTDHWELDRAQFIQIASEGMRQFFYLSIEPANWQITPAESDHATTTVDLTFQGNGTGLGQIALNRLTSLEEPFTFHWRKESWQPWSWRLYSAEQSELRLSRDWSFQ
ncbi:MAG: hypothetical protein WA771_07825 [Chthoniobacterales bacterium]